MPPVKEVIKLYTILETAQALKVTPQTVRGWIKKGKLKSQKPSNHILVREADIKEFLNHK